MTAYVERPCSRCCGGLFEPVENGVVACVYCGLRERHRGARVPATARTPGEHRLETGRYAGETVAAVAKKPGGQRYLEWMANANDEVRKFVQSTAPPNAGSGGDSTASVAEP